MRQFSHDEIRTRKIIAARVMLARQQRKLSKTALSKKLGFEQSYISRVELGKIGLHAERLPKIAEALGVDIYWFYKPIDFLDCQASLASQQRS